MPDLHEQVRDVLRRVAVVIPPFTSLDFPSLEASVLHAGCIAGGAQSEMLYLNQVFADCVGRMNYAAIASTQRTVGIGDWVGGAPLRHPDPPFPAETLALRRFDTFADYLRLEHGFPKAFASLCEGMAQLVEPFLEETVYGLPWKDFAVVAISCKHQQLGFAASLARQLRKSGYQSPIYLFGEMLNGRTEAAAALRVFPWIDGVLVRSPSTIASSALQALLDRTPAPGLLLRNDPNYLEPKRDSLSIGALAFSPRFETFYDNFVQDGVQSVLPYQSSHGCKWGDRSHCTFCGLIEEGQRYSAKPGNQVLSELLHLSTKHQLLDIVTADLLLDESYFSDFIPALTKLDLDLSLFYELRASLSKQRLLQLQDAGITHVQVGIESFDSNSLKEMGKGTTCLQNIRFLKWCAELGINVSWIYLFGFPGETAATLQKQARLAVKLRHLQPPIAVTPVRIERNSPMFSRPNAFGMTVTGPAEYYLHTYPHGPEDLSDLAVEFAHSYEDGRDVEGDSRDLRRDVENWQLSWEPNLLYFRKGPGFLKVCDFRSEERVITLTGWKAYLYEVLDVDHSEERLFSILNERGNEVSRERLRETLANLDREGLVWSDNGRWLALAPRADRNAMVRASISRRWMRGKP